MNFNKLAFIIMPLFCFVALRANASESKAYEALSLDESISSLPDDMMSFLYDGAVLPVYMTTSDSVRTDDSQKTALDVAEAEIGLLEGKVYLKKVTFSDKSKLSYVSKDVLQIIDSASGKSFDGNGTLVLNEHANIELDFYTMRLQLVLDSEGFGIYQKDADNKKTFIPDSSSSSVTGVVDYDFNLSQSFGNTTSSSNNFSLDSVFSYAENHLNVAGAYYGNNGSGELSLDKLLIERDYKGMRISAGMLDGWSMQSLSSISTMGNERLYGLSFGNDSRTSIKNDEGRSIIPLEVYLPTPGEVKVYRDGRLISVQQFTIGRHNLETKDFPNGIYDVDTEIISGGKTIDKKTFRVNKSTNAGAQGLKWQVFSGVAQQRRYWDNSDCEGDPVSWMDIGTSGCNDSASVDTTSSDNKWLLGAGVSFSKWDWNYDGSIYFKENVIVNENWLNWSPSELFKFDLQSILTSQNEHDLVGTITGTLPNGVGSLWVTKEKGNDFDERRIDYSSRDYFSIGGNVSLQSILPENSSISLGSMNFTHEIDNTQNTKLNRLDYNQTIYSNTLGSVDFQLGMSNEQYFDSDSEMKQLYVNVNFSIPLGVDFDIGYSKQGDEDSMSLAVGKEFEDSAITYANISMNKYLNGDQQFLYNSYVNYDTKYNNGTLSVSGGDGNANISLSSQGAFSLGNSGLAFGNGDAEAGIVISLPDAVGNDDLEVEIGGEVYPLASGNTLVPVSAYNSYDVNVRVSGNAVDSYDLSIDDDSYTVYPGNVINIEPVVKKMVTVFGRLIDNSGQAIANANIKNHIGYTVTDDNGYFSIDVDKSHPVLKVDSESTGEFEVKMSFENANSAQAMGTITWEGPFMTSYSLNLQPNDGEVG